MATEELHDPIDSRITIRGRIDGAKEGLGGRLPASKVPWTSGHVPLGAPGAAYRGIHAKLPALRLGRDRRRRTAPARCHDDDGEVPERALWEFHAARQAVAAALGAMRRLSNTPLPWSKQRVQEVVAAMAALEDDSVPTMVRTAAAVAAGEAPSAGPLRDGTRSFLAILEDPGPNAWHRLRLWTDDLEDLAARYVGEKTSVFVDRDRVERFIFPGGRDEPINVVMSAFRARRNYFGGRHGRAPAALKPCGSPSMAVSGGGSERWPPAS